MISLKVSKRAPDHVLSFHPPFISPFAFQAWNQCKLTRNGHKKIDGACCPRTRNCDQQTQIETLRRKWLIAPLRLRSAVITPTVRTGHGPRRPWWPIHIIMRTWWKGPWSNPARVNFRLSSFSTSPSEAPEKPACQSCRKTWMIAPPTFAGRAADEVDIVSSTTKLDVSKPTTG